mmetsp:Transcript_146/g.351  ORF Transcript_146/g.351 Transcript_146/m.351 type:complete len:636 (+) Transcript_146:233-2140(+)
MRLQLCNRTPARTPRVPTRPHSQPANTQPHDGSHVLAGEHRKRASLDTPTSQPPVRHASPLAESCGSDDQVKLLPPVRVLFVVLKRGVKRDQRVLRADVQVVVHLPVGLAHLPRRVEETLQRVRHDNARPQRQTAPVDRAHDAVDKVRADLKNVGPHVVEQVRDGVFAAEASNTERNVRAHRRRGLPVHEVAVHQRVLQQRRDRIDVVLAHLPDVLKHERERLEHAVLHVELGRAVLVHERRQHSERCARLCHDRDRDRRTHAVLALLHLEVVEKRDEHVLRANRLCNVAKRVDCRAADGLLVRLEHFEQLEADAHPLARRDKARAAVGDAAHQVDALLLHLFMPVLEHGREPRQQLLDGRRHLGHADDVDDALERTQDASQHLGVLLSKVLVQHHTQMGQQRLLIACLHDWRDARNEVGGLLPDLGRLVVEPPLDRAADLAQVGLGAPPKRVDDSAEAVEHHVGVVCDLLLERKQDAVDEQLLKARVHVRRTERRHHLVDRLHDHAPVRLALVLEVLHHTRHNVRRADLVGQLHCRLHECAVIAAVERHAPVPEALEELGQHIGADILRLHTLGAHALLHDLEHNLLHLLVGRLELALQHDHDLARVVERMFGVHERDDEADGLEERSEHLAAQ